MALVLKDRVQELTTTTGQGTLTLAGAVSGYQTFAAIGNSNTTYYTIVDPTTYDWEIGIGTYTSSGTTLSRDTVISNSLGTTAKVSFGVGIKNVFCTYPAEQAVYVDGTSIIPGSSATLPISQGGTGSSTATFSGANITSLNASNISSGTIANARTTAASANGASTIVARDASGNFTGYNVSATNFIGTLNGSGANVTSLNASNVSSGTLAIANGGTGSSTATFSGENITSLNASNISSGTIANARTTAASANGASTIVARDASGNFTGYNVSATNFIGALNGSGANVTSINASNISAGTIGNAYTTAASANGASTIVARDASGNFSANTITASLTGNVSGSAATFTSTTQNSQFYSIGVNTAASGTAGEIRATNNVTAYYSSDRRFKENIRPIEHALDTVVSIGGVMFDWTDEYIEEHGGVDGYFVNKADFGVIAQDVQAVFPVAVRQRNDGSLAVDYEKLCALAFAAIKELKTQIDLLKR